MANCLLDTNILSYWYDEHCEQHDRVIASFDELCQKDKEANIHSHLFISAITLGEIAYGHRVAPNPNAAQQADYLRFVKQMCPEPLEVTKHVAEQYGGLKAWLFNHCGPNSRRSKAKRAEELCNPVTGRELGIDENDIWIAAHAITHGLTFVTNDTRGPFGKLLRKYCPSIDVAYWAR